MSFKARIKRFFFPGPDAPRKQLILPFLVLGLLAVIALGVGNFGWEYTNSPKFCGTTCHTMPPQSVSYLKSPHANVTCEECHIGRAALTDQLMRKSQALREIRDTVFHLYTYPIYAEALRPALDTCEKCHKPEAFLGDKFRTITHFQNDTQNTRYDTYLILKTGGGTKVEGQGLGIHWHISNKVEYFEADPLGQSIPYVRVYNEDGTTTEYTDIESGFDPASMDASKLRTMDCTSCHNRVSHNFKTPAASMDDYMARKAIDPTIPDIHQKGIEVLSNTYQTQAEGLKAISGLENYYQTYYADYYGSHTETVKTAITQIQTIYTETVFLDQKINWETHPNNLGHMQTAGCFRCHDGKHLNANQQAIRLECNLCHSIPTVAQSQDFVTRLEISRGPEPDSHRNANWISLHNKSYNATCVNCHTVQDAGSTSNTSFCSNSACHGNVFQYAGFNAPKLREILQAQLPTPEPTPPSLPVEGTPTFANIGPLFATKCTVCHNGDGAPAGLILSSYADALKGGQSGPVIVPNDSANSKLIAVQSAKHFSNLSTDELELVKQWIDAGAPEQ
jgi:hypothetical protein